MQLDKTCPSFCLQPTSILGSVRQGSTLSSLLFLSYLNDIEEGIKSEISLFAEDVALLNKFQITNTLERKINIK